MRRILPICVLMAGCVQQPAVQQSGAEVPVSQQSPVGDARNRAKIHADLGMAYFRSGQIAIAMDEARIAIASDPNYAPAYNLFGLAHMYLQENALAQLNFERALRLAPNDPEVHNSYGSFLCQNGREKEGISHFMSAVKNPLYTTPTIPYTNAGRCALQTKDSKAAEDFFRKALAADPTNVVAMLDLGDILFRKANYIEARQLVNTIHRQVEPNAATLWLGVRIERKLGDRDAENGYASQLRRKFVGSPEYQALSLGNYE